MSPQTETKNPETTPAGPQTFYSSAAGLIVNINFGRRIMEAGGTTKMVDQKVAEFTPQADGYGRLVTADPEIIDNLTKRQMSSGDVFDGVEYLRRTTPAEVRLADLQRSNTRLLEDHNRLLAKIAADQKLVAPKQPMAPPISVQK